MNKKMVWVVLWLLALAGCLLGLDRAMRRDDSERKYGSFYAEEQAFDVLFFGTSRVLDGVTPMELWRDYGITSYNMGNNSEPLGMTRYTMEYAFSVHTPKIAVIDVFYVMHALDEAWTYPYRHIFLDSVPFGAEKFDIVKNTLPKEKWIEFMAPFSLYHGRWDEILSGGGERMVECETFTMGSEMRAARWHRGDSPITDAIQEAPLIGEGALREMVALCRERGVEPVLVALPGEAYEHEQMAMNAVAPLAQEWGVPFVNMVGLDIVDITTDCNDWSGHLNPDGATKTTAFLGAWLKEHYALEDKRGDSAFAHWDENLMRYEAHREEVWGEQTKLTRVPQDQAAALAEKYRLDAPLDK